MHKVAILATAFVAGSAIGSAAPASATTDRDAECLAAIDIVSEWNINSPAAEAMARQYYGDRLRRSGVDVASATAAARRRLEGDRLINTFERCSAEYEAHLRG